MGKLIRNIYIGIQAFIEEKKKEPLMLCIVYFELL